MNKKTIMKINKEEILNAKISKPSLYVEDHGILTFDFILEGYGFGCCYGGYCIGHPIDYTASESGLIAMMHIMDVVGVNRWEDLDGKYCRVKSNGWGSIITCIGNLIDDEWFDIKEFFENYKCDDSKPTYSEPAYIQNVYNRMANRGATREELDSFRNLIHKYNALEYTANKEDNGND